MIDVIVGVVEDDRRLFKAILSDHADGIDDESRKKIPAWQLHMHEMPPQAWLENHYRHVRNANQSMNAPPPSEECMKNLSRRLISITPAFRSVLAQIAERHLGLKDVQMNALFPGMPPSMPSFQTIKT